MENIDNIINFYFKHYIKYSYSNSLSIIDNIQISFRKLNNDIELDKNYLFHNNLNHILSQIIENIFKDNANNKIYVRNILLESDEYINFYNKAIIQINLMNKFYLKNLTDFENNRDLIIENKDIKVYKEFYDLNNYYKKLIKTFIKNTNKKNEHLKLNIIYESYIDFYNSSHLIYSKEISEIEKLKERINIFISRNCLYQKGFSRL